MPVLFLNKSHDFLSLVAFNFGVSCMVKLGSWRQGYKAVFSCTEKAQTLYQIEFIAYSIFTLE